MQLPWWRTVAGLVLLLAVPGAWVRGLSATDGWYWHVERRPHRVSRGLPVAQDEYVGIELTRHALLVGSVRRGAPNAPGFVGASRWTARPYVPTPLAAVAPAPNWLNFGQRGSFATRDTADWVVRLPFWFLTLAGVLAAGGVCAGPFVAARKVRAGLCPHCGYDLRASPDRCPECGADLPGSAGSPRRPVGMGR